MFNCEKCGETSKPREKQTKVVLEKRVIDYGIPSKKDKTKSAVGWEVVKEINVCERCAKEI